MSEPNVPLLRKAVEWVEEQDKLPEVDSKWFQREWVTNADYRARTLAYEGVNQMASDLISTGHVMSTTEILDKTAQAKYWLSNHCGTAYCVAGYIAAMTNEAYINDWRPKGLPSVSEYAQQQLGIDIIDADALFAGGNNAQDVRMIAERIAGERL